MKIEIDGCNGFTNGFLKDLSGYNKINKYLTDMIETYPKKGNKIRKLNFYPLQLLVNFDGKTHTLIEDGCVTEKARKYLKKINNLPPSDRSIPNDYMQIGVDIFERELYINLN